MFNLNDIIGRDVVLENGAIGKIKGISETSEPRTIIVTIDLCVKKEKVDIFSFAMGLVELIDKKLQDDLYDWIIRQTDLAEIDAPNSEITRRLGNDKLEPRPLIDKRRNANKPAIFLVCQSVNFNDESRDGYIWAPNDSEPSHIELEFVKEGDIIFHHFENQLKAISLALGYCEQAVPPSGDHPDEIRRGIKGKIVSLEYHFMAPAVDTRGLKSLKQKYGTDGTPARRYRPFNVDGNNQQGGYLYELPDELALAFVDEALKVNPGDAFLTKIKNKI